MKILHGWKTLALSDRGACVAYGNFDGVHLGHQKVIADAAKAAQEMSALLGVISFEPHARTHFQPDAPPFRLMTANQLARTASALGVERLYFLPFGAEMAGLSDQEFANKVLAAGLGVRHVAVGFDVTFGKNRTGDPDAMRAYGKDLGFTVSVAGAVQKGDQKVSSSAVREALRAGLPERAAGLLGRPFAMEGVVQKGQQLSRKLGFPTANVELGDYVAPLFGAYATRTRLADGRRLPGIANIGLNPNTCKVAPRLDVSLFDFDEDIYGETIETDLIALLRPEDKFGTPQTMIEQTRRDVAVARALLGN